jgi:aryl-alcohol dehydrogenase-like predicted oxidoreductase
MLLIAFVGQGGAAFGAPNTITRINTIPEAQEVVDLFLSHGQSGFDTARSYGYGTSEEVCPQGVHVDEHILTSIRPQSKFFGKLDLHGSLVDTKYSAL